MDWYCLTGQSPHWAVAPMEEEEEKGFTLSPLVLVHTHLIFFLRSI
jgi:hypothetical protein